MEFTIKLDNPAFTSSVKSPVKIDSKKVLAISVAYKAVPGGSSNGRLTISNSEQAWVFYLQGE
jgi:hydrocephalus-inducing protein